MDNSTTRFMSLALLVGSDVAMAIYSEQTHQIAVADTAFVESATGVEAYEIGEQLKFDEPGQADLFFATNKETKSEVVIKRIKRSKAQASREKDVNQRIAFAEFNKSQEEESHIIQVHEVREDTNYFYFVMEKCAGDLLGVMKDLWKQVHREFYQGKHKEFFPLANVKKVMTGILSGIKTLHDRDYVHRDIKPDNFVFTRKLNGTIDWDSIKAIDFGLTCRDRHCKDSRAGTLEYMAPEVFKWERNEPVSYGKPCDIYSAGVVMYMLLCYFLPFELETMRQQVDRLRQGESDEFPHGHPAELDWPILYELQALEYNFNFKFDVSDNAKNLIKDMLHKDPAKRPTVDECLQRLEAI